MILLTACLYLLSLRGRAGHPGLPELRKWRYAHRGLYDTNQPENSMAAFRAALEKGYGIELDVHLLRDGALAVMHDSSLLRTTGREGKLEELTAADLANCYLEGTGETIPLFSQVLALFDGKAPLIVELKVVGNNYVQLCQRVCEWLDDYRGPFCVESFDPRCLLWLKKHRPDYIRGQLTENYFDSKARLPWTLKTVLTHQLGNFLTKPDFTAYRYKDRQNLGNFLARKLWKLQGVIWTVQNPEELALADREGYISIFEHFEP